MFRFAVFFFFGLIVLIFFGEVIIIIFRAAIHLFFSELISFWLGGGLSEFFMMFSLYFEERITIFSDRSFFEENKTWVKNIQPGKTWI